MLGTHVYETKCLLWRLSNLPIIQLLLQFFFGNKGNVKRKKKKKEGVAGNVFTMGKVAK